MRNFSDHEQRDSQVSSHTASITPNRGPSQESADAAQPRRADELRLQELQQRAHDSVAMREDQDECPGTVWLFSILPCMCRL